MSYFVFPLLSSWGSVISLSWAVFCASEWVEEAEHLIFVFISLLLIFVVYPCVEAGMFFWSTLTLVIISVLFLMTSPLFVYVAFELALLPMVLLVLGWGVQPERVSATFHLFVYTLVFSSPLFASVLLCESGMEFKSSSALSFLMSLAFMVKLPLFLLHVWLPKAHVEAPTGGSIILAGILLKMGGVGFLWMQNLCLGGTSLFWLVCAGSGAAASAFLCCFQSDVKSLIAYSSVAHMNFSLVVLYFVSGLADSSSSLLMLSHSFISSLLFLLGGTCFHLLGSRVVYFFRSSFLFKSMLVCLFMMVVSSNFSLPPSLGFLGEASSFFLGFSKVWSLGLIVFVYFFLVSYYSLFLGFSFCGQSEECPFESSACFLNGAGAFVLFNFCFLLFY